MNFYFAIRIAFGMMMSSFSFGEQRQFY